MKIDALPFVLAMITTKRSSKSSHALLSKVLIKQVSYLLLIILTLSIRTVMKEGKNKERLDRLSLGTSAQE